MKPRALVTLLLFAGCGNDNSSDAAAFRSYYTSNLQHYCEAVFRCCTPAQAAAKGSDVSDCANKLNAKIQPSLTPFYAALDAGTLHVVPAAVQACVDLELNVLASCDGPYSLATNLFTCRGTVTGAQPIGAACDPNLATTCAPGGLGNSG